MFHDELAREREVRKISSDVNRISDIREALRSTLERLRRTIGCSAIAIRLEEGGDYPYYLHEGFSDSFVLREGSLCATTSQGERIPDPARTGSPLLECLCGNVLTGRIVPSQPWYTPFGSFFINDSMRLVEEADPETLAHAPRFSCIRSGYASMGLVPLRSGAEILGLLQVNDRRSGFFDAEMRLFLEAIADSIGPLIRTNREQVRFEALQKVYSAVKEESDLKTLFLASGGQYFQTTVNSLRGMMDLLSLTPLDDEQARLVELMRKSATGLSSTLQNLVDSARIDTGRLEPLQLPFRLSDFLKGMETNYAHQAARKGLLFRMEKVGHLPDTLIGDETRFNQVLSILIGNAVKYTESGFVIVQISSTQADCGDTRLRVVVRDSGPGIPKEKAGHLFVPFGNQAAAEREAAKVDFGVNAFSIGSAKAAGNLNEGGGTNTAERLNTGGGTNMAGNLKEGPGLGLPIARGLARLMRGDLDFETVPGQGTAFVAEFLMQAAGTEGWPNSTDQAEMLAALRTLSSHSVLLVEDDGINASLLTGCLAQGGMTVHRAANARECMDLLSRYRVSAILMDIRLPEMDGCELTQMIRRSELEGEHVPILAMTAKTSDADRALCLKSGMDGYLPKPVHMGYLVDQLRMVLQVP